MKVPLKMLHTAGRVKRQVLGEILLEFVLLSLKGRLVSEGQSGMFGMKTLFPVASLVNIFDTSSLVPLHKPCERLRLRGNIIIAPTFNAKRCWVRSEGVKLFTNCVV